jgi:hypothetical protein
MPWLPTKFPASDAPDARYGPRSDNALSREPTRSRYQVVPPLARDEPKKALWGKVYLLSLFGRRPEKAKWKSTYVLVAADDGAASRAALCLYAKPIARAKLAELVDDSGRNVASWGSDKAPILSGHSRSRSLASLWSLIQASPLGSGGRRPS